jgi:hypothetical protein
MNRDKFFQSIIVGGQRRNLFKDVNWFCDLYVERNAKHERKNKKVKSKKI